MAVLRRPSSGPARRAVERALDVAADPRRLVRQVRPHRFVASARAWQATRRPAPALGPVLPPAQALRENGFTVFRQLVPADECAVLAADLKRDAGITSGLEFTRVDATIKFPRTRDVLFDPRVLDAVRTAVSDPVVRFLQVSDLHYLHDTAGWHRDSVHREVDSSAAADWDDDRYGVVKAILYLESDNAAMGLMAGSHLSPREIDRDFVKAVEKRGGQVVIDRPHEPNRRFSPAERQRPMAWKAQVGDLLVFDERMYHAGRRVDSGRVTGEVQAAKFTLSLVFGPENTHSWRLYSYFRYARRELHYKAYPADYRAALAEHDLLPADLGNYYLQHPDELRLAHLRHPEAMDDLVAEFTRLGAQQRAGR